MARSRYGISRQDIIDYQQGDVFLVNAYYYMVVKYFDDPIASCEAPNFDIVSGTLPVTNRAVSL